MKILFVENRYKTGFWEIIAKELMEDGHEIFWIIQNHTFKPKIGSSIFIPYPEKEYTGKKEYTSEVKKIVTANRGMNYFDVKNDDFIFYYKEKIQKAIDIIVPDIVFGEPTLFHELLIISECRKRSILYLNPTSCRYPVGRISFYKYDTLETYGGSGEEITDEEARHLIDEIVSGKVVLDYMQTTSKPVVSKTDKILDKLKISMAYLQGERYNTPSPLCKIELEQRKKKVIALWEHTAEKKIKDSRHLKVLYPMQMQPEANIDVWGYPFNNQENVIKWIIEQLPNDGVLYIKPNPKSKYELTTNLLEMATRFGDKVRILSHKTTMTDIFPKVDFIVTVTGTISYECIWGNKPFLMLGDAMQKKYCRVNADSLKDVLKMRDLEAFVVPDEDKIQFMKELVYTSYPAIVTDTLNGKKLLETRSVVSDIIKAFRHILPIVKFGELTVI